MADHHAVTKTRPNSSNSPADVGSTNGTLNASPPCGSSVFSASQTYANKEFIMMPPEEKLRHFDSRAQAHEDNQEFNACIQDLVRCVALTRLVYGEGHLKLAQAHARLAKAYFQFKGWGLQAQEHYALARELLPFCSSISSCREEKLEVLMCLLSVHLTKGGASLLMTNLEEAESSFLEAEQVVEELQQRGGISQDEKIKTELEISTGLSRVYKRQNRLEEAFSQCEKSLQLLKDSGRPEKTCSVYRDMAAIEQEKGQLDRAIEHLSKAHAIAMSHNSEELEGARISHSLALILSAAAEPHHNDSAGYYFEQSLNAYKKSAGPHDPAFLAAQEDFCRFLLFNGQQEVTHTHTHLQTCTAARTVRQCHCSASLLAKGIKEIYVVVVFADAILKCHDLHILCSESSTMETPIEFVIFRGFIPPAHCMWLSPLMARDALPVFNLPLQKCVEIQRSSLDTKRSTFGDLSAEVADTLQLIGSVEMTEGRMKQAHRTMTKCLEIQSLLYGSQHKKTKTTQKAVDMLARVPEVAEGQHRRGRRKTRPHTFPVVPPSSNDGNSMSDS